VSPACEYRSCAKEAVERGWSSRALDRQPLRPERKIYLLECKVGCKVDFLGIVMKDENSEIKDEPCACVPYTSPSAI
jgi:hypothetical protein